jgi:hypothetical protein
MPVMLSEASGPPYTADGSAEMKTAATTPKSIEDRTSEFFDISIRFYSFFSNS